MAVQGWEPPAGSIDDQAIAWLSYIKADDAACQAQFELWYTTDAAHAAAFDALLDDWDKTALIAHSDAAQARGRGHPRASLGMALAWYAAAAAVVLMIGLGTGVYMFGRGGVSPSPVGARVASRVGEVRTVALADGSRVTLDTDTVLVTDFGQSERRLRLEQGRARFDVARDATRPFIVTADEATVTAHGTVFDVAYVDDTLSVALFRGAVEVTATRPGRPRAQMLKPGQGISFAPVSHASVLRALGGSELAWTTGMLAFADTSLVDAATTANRYSATKILLEDDGTRQLRVTGRFPARDVDGFARSLAASFHLAIRRDADGNYRLGATRS